MNVNNEIHAVDIARTREDFFAFGKHAYKAFNNLRIYYFVAIIVSIALLSGVVDFLNRKQYLPSVLVTVTLIFGVILLLIFLRRIFDKKYQKEVLNDNQAFLRKKRIMIDSEGLRETSDVSEGYVMWQGIDRIERTDKLLLVYVDKMHAFVIPIRNFSSPEQANQFYENMLAYWHKAHGRAQPVDPQ